MSQQDDCKNCHKAGLPILPVRYAVVPNTLPNKLPGALKAPGVKDLALAKHHYALRTLRQGFLYLFYEKRWGKATIIGNSNAPPTCSYQVVRSYEVYSVADDGTLWRQSHAYGAAPLQEPVCNDTAHHVPASVIAIENPEKSGIVWIAYSEHLWSASTLEAYGNDAALRARRMQKLDPAAWLAKPQHDHGLVADAQTVEEIVEYAPREPTEILPPADEPPLTDDKGRHKPAILTSVRSRYRVARRAGQAGETVKCMRAFGKYHPEKEPHPPMVLALTDAIGAAHELNGFRNEPAGRIEQYQKEREMELSALANIKGLEQALKKRAGDNQARLQEHMRQRDTIDTRLIAPRRARAANLAEPGRSQVLEGCAILEGWAARQVPSGYGMRLDRISMGPEPERSREIAALRREVEEFLASRQKHGEENIRNVQQKSWESYAERVNVKQRERFEKNYQAFGTAVGQLVDERTDDLLVWLKSTALLDTLTEYHSDSIADSVAFEDKVGNALLGIGSSPKGAQQLEDWVAETKVTEKNLVWRTVALNHAKSAEELNQALQEAKQYKNDQTLASALDWADYAGKSLKTFFSTHKNAARLYATNTKAALEDSKAHGVSLRPINTRGIDYLAMTACDKIVQFFRVDHLAEYASEKVIQHVFSLRAFTDPEDSAKLIQVQAENAEAVRVQTLERQRAGATLLAMDQPPLKTTHTEAYRRGWSEFTAKARSSESGLGVLKDCRVSILVLLIEGFNFSKLLGDCYRKNDGKSWITLGASLMTMTSALFDVATVPAKALFGADSMSLQRLKLGGGLFSAGATMVGVYYDAQEVLKAHKAQDSSLEFLYFAKASAGGLGAAVSLVSTFTYAAPLIGRLTGSAALEATTLVAGTRAAAIIGARILFMSAGAWITVGTFAIQIFIWSFYPSELEKWVGKCALGIDRDRGWTANRQQDELTNALESVGMSEKKS